jgi:hypothetical protein
MDVHALYGSDGLYDRRDVYPGEGCAQVVQFLID